MVADENSSPEIKSDTEWKDRVKAEAAALDAETSESEKPASETRSSAVDIDEERLPPATFETMVQMFSTQAMVALGAIAEPGSDEPVRRPSLARHFIDMLSVLEEKTKGNLAESEEQLLTSSVHYLRMAFLEQSKQAAAGKGDQPPETPES
ncbi:MAG: DUF1844 domain-containing protein [Planctomycetota bacterium]|nr:MAG: DUF1844 domain-containing protein [Planctomycetota bacterium]REK26501.1 MAG: DUF1844 domain-containing protein [Planctomycetota bacterium]